MIASVHADDILDIKQRQEFKNVLKDRVFERFIVLSNKKQIGTCEYVYDENLNCIYF